jgi:thioredoxin 1
MRGLIGSFQTKTALLALALILVLGVAHLPAQQKEKAMGKEGIAFTTGKWQDVLAKAKKSGKYIFVDAYTSWCGPCKLLKSKTFKEEKAADYFNAHFVNYTLDMEKGEGISLAEQWAVTAYPTLLFFNPNGKLVMRQVGFVNGDKLVDFGQQAKSKQ